MTTSIIRAGGTGVPGVQTTAGNDGALALKVGPLAATVEALNIAASGAATFVDAVAITGDLTANNFAGRNRIINPSGVINQRGAQTAANGYFSDRWYAGTGGTAVVNGNTVSGYLELDVTTADTSVAATDLGYIYQSIEGFNTADLLIGTASAKTITISFKHKHTKTGINCCAVSNSASNRNYIFEYTQSVANTEETHSETITLDTSGTWIGATNGKGLTLLFTTFSGTNFHGSADTWQAGNLTCTSYQVNNMDSVSNFFRITDVQLEEGTVATELEYRPYGTELALCQRYYCKTFNQGTAPAQNAGTAGALVGTGSVTDVGFGSSWFYPVVMRAIPTVTTYSPSAASANWSSQGGKIPTASVTTKDDGSAGIRATGVVAAGGYYTIHIAASAEL
jgi:hypothetical protein